MDKGSKKRPRDPNELAKFVVGVATGEIDDTVSKKEAAARKAGKAGGRARADALSSEKRIEIAKKAAKARWNKKG